MLLALAAAAAAAKPEKRALKLSTNGEDDKAAAAGPNFEAAAAWACRNGSGKGNGSLGRPPGLNLAKMSAWAARALCCCCCLNCMNWLSPFSNMAGEGVGLIGRRDEWPPADGGGGGEGGEYSLTAILKPWCLGSHCITCTVGKSTKVCSNFINTALFCNDIPNVKRKICEHQFFAVGAATVLAFTATSMSRLTCQTVVSHFFNKT